MLETAHIIIRFDVPLEDSLRIGQAIDTLHTEMQTHLYDEGGMNGGFEVVSFTTSGSN